MAADGPPPVLVEGVDDGPLGRLRQVGHHLGNGALSTGVENDVIEEVGHNLCNDDRAGAGREGQVVGAPLVDPVPPLDGQPDEQPDGHVEEDVDGEPGVGEASQGGLGVVDGGGPSVYLLLGASSVGGSGLQHRH